jgi:hypothetical protein
MPFQGEKWFKGMALDPAYCNDYLKPEYQNENLSKGVPRNHMIDHYDKLLRVIQRYFTCEGRFNMVYQYHIRLLMHFTGKKALNLPFYLYRSLGKMVDKVQAKSKQIEHNVFHFGLIKLLVLEELRKTNGEWDSFFSTIGFSPEATSSPPSKRSTLSTSDKAASGGAKRKRSKGKEQQPSIVETPESTAEIFLSKESKEKKKGKKPLEKGMKNVEDVVETPDSKKSKKKGRKLEFTAEAVEMLKPRKPLTRSTAKKLSPVDEGATEVHIHHETEEIAEVQLSSGKKVMFSQEVSVKEKPSRPMTRSTTRNLAYKEETRSETPIHHEPVQVIEVHSPSEESDIRVKRTQETIKGSTSSNCAVKRGE